MGSGGLNGDDCSDRRRRQTHGLELVSSSELQEELDSSHSWGVSAYTRSPSTPRSRQAALTNLKLLQDGSPRLHTPRRVASSNSASSDEKVYSGEESVLPVYQRHVSRNRSLRVSRLANGLPTSTRKRGSKRKSARAVLFWSMLFAFLFLLNWWMLSRLQDARTAKVGNSVFPNWLQGEWSRFPKDKRPPGVMYDRLLGLAAHALAEGELKPEPSDLWEEPYADASAWKPCSDKRKPDHQSPPGPNSSTGYVMVSANGGLNQQRVAVCNAVAVSSLLNATLVLPRFLYNSVWKDNSQFADIYQEEYFMDFLKDDVTVVKNLPINFQSLNLEAIGSVVTDMDVIKEAKPSFYVTKILPILLRNRVVHFYGFGNRLSFDPIPHDLQRLRCRCNFHALKFSSNIQKTGAVLVERMRGKTDKWGPLEKEIVTEGGVASQERGYSTADLSHLGMLVGIENLGGISTGLVKQSRNPKGEAVKYLGLHLRFEIDMAAYSTCEFGGGEAERQELEMYREIHFPTLTMYKKNGKLPSAAQLREEGRCPLTPEEAVLMLVALGFKRQTRIYLAGAHIYGGQSRMIALTTLYPNLVTKEDLLSPQELAPYANSSSQLAALDFIGCAAADIFAMTDSGSQLSSLVSGYRIYYGGGLMPTIRPNKRRLASIFLKNMTIEWDEFRDRIRKTVRESKKVQVRPIARSIYRHPRCPDCMCNEKDPNS